MIGFRLTVLEAQRIAVLHAALPPDADEIAELEAFLPALARRGFPQAVLDLSAAPPLDAGEAALLRSVAARLHGQGIRLVLVGGPDIALAAGGLGLAVHHQLSDALARHD